MIEFLGMIFLMWILFKAAGIMLRVFGRIAGFFLGSIGYLILGIVAVTVIGMAAFVLPLILIAGIGGLIAQSSNAI